MSTQLFSKTTAEIDADPANFLVVVHGGGQVELMMPQSGSKFFSVVFCSGSNVAVVYEAILFILVLLGESIYF